MIHMVGKADIARAGLAAPASAAAFIIVVLALALAPYALGSYGSALVDRMMIYAIFAISLNLLVGFTGIASLGHAAFFGAGGYTIALLTKAGVDSFLLLLIAAILASVVLAASFAVLILRASGPYQLMITLALAQVLWGLAYSWRAVTGGDDGIPGVGLPTSIAAEGGFAGLHAIIVGFFALTFAANWFFARSPFGKSLIGIRENGKRMRVLGFNIWLHKFIACILSGGIAGSAGALLAWDSGFISPSSLNVSTSALVLIMVIFGGAGTAIGPVVGAFVLIGLESVVSALTDRWILVLGVVYILTSLFAPQGIVPLLAWRTKVRL